MTAKPTNIHAYTEPGCDYPAFLSINTTRPGVIELTVRSRGHAGTRIGTIELTPEQCEQMSMDIMSRLYGEAQEGVE